MTTRRIGIMTGGGDCPGLNAAVRAVAKTAITDYSWEVVGIHDGFEGLLKGRSRELTFNDVSNILPLGGTILGTSNRADPFNHTEKEGGRPYDASDEVVKNLARWKIDILFCIGGDGTLKIAHRLFKKWPGIIGIPKTIDNDLKATDQSFGFDTAASFVTEAMDRIHSTAQSHHRVMIVEVMGRYAGWIALEGGIAGGGDIILIPEIPFDFDTVVDVVNQRSRKGKRFSIIVAAEGAKPVKEGYTVKQYVKDSPDPVRLGGIGERVAEYISRNTSHEARVTVLGHLQRGGPPTFFDRILATRYGVAAVRLGEKRMFGKMVALRGTEITAVDLEEAASGLRLVTPDHPLVIAAKSLGTSFGVSS
jgi:6-phosphofructokinase 1